MPRSAPATSEHAAAQLSLPFFDAPGADAASSAARTATPSAPPRERQLNPSIAPVAPAKPEAAPVAPKIASTPPNEAPALFRHPHANREVRLDGHLVAYELKRARRRTIGFVIGDDGLVVSAPRWVGQAEIDAGLQEKSRWILRKLAEQAERRRRLESARIAWGDGATLPFLGETVTLVLDARVTGAVLHTHLDAPQGQLAGVPQLMLHVGLPQTADAAQIRDTVQAWLMRQARRIFEERCALYAPRLGVQVRRLALSSAGTRWGSASADGSIRLHWRLVHFAMSTIDYVVCHELAHLRHMDHSPRFWDVVRSVMPDYETARGLLRDEVLPQLD